MSDSQTRLRHAVLSGYLEKVRYLVTKYGLYDSEGHSYVLHKESLKSGQYDISKFLLSKGGRVLEYNNVEMIEILLYSGADIYQPNEFGLSALGYAIYLLLKRFDDLSVDLKNEHVYTLVHYLVFTNDVEIVEMLLRRNVNINVKNAEGFTPLHIASENGHVEIIKLLLAHNAEINCFANNLKSPLYLAVEKAHSDAAKYLITKGANVNVEVDGKTILNWAVDNSLLIVEDVLKQCPHKENQNNKNSLKNAAQMSNKNSPKIVEYLLNYGFSVEPSDVNDSYLFDNCIKMGYVKIVEDLIGYGLDLTLINKKNRRLFHIAVKNKQLQMAKLLLTYGADISVTDYYGKPSIHYSTGNCDVQLTKLLLEHGADVNAKTVTGLTALHIACQQGSPEMTKVLLQHKADVDCTETSRFARDEGYTALHFAAKIGNASIIEMLLANGANVNFKGSKSNTPLHMAANAGDVEALKTLLTNGADVYSKNSEGLTPLHVASGINNPEIVFVLLEHESPIDSQDSHGNTPLHTAIKYKNIDIVKSLLKYEPDLKISNFNNSTALELIDCNNLKLYTTFQVYFMLKTANIDIDERSLKFVDKEYDIHIQEYKEKCENEIRKIKTENIANLKLSYYDIIRKRNMASLVNFARNKNVLRVFESEHYKTKFPIYAPIIEINFKMIMKRERLVEPASEFFISYFGLYRDCTDGIFNYLNNEDLGNIIKCMGLHLPSI